MTQDEYNVKRQQLIDAIHAAECKRDERLANEPNIVLDCGRHAHALIKMSCTQTTKALKRKLAKLETTAIDGISEQPVYDVHIQQRIAELERERDELLASTEFVKYGPKRTSHAPIKRAYNQRITMLKRYGVEYCAQVQEIRQRSQETKLVRYGNKFGNVELSKQTKLERYGNAGAGNIEKMKSTKIARYGNAFCGDYAKAQKTKELRYGSRGAGNIAKMLATRKERYGDYRKVAKRGADVKRAKYGHPWGPLSKIQASANKTNIERYGVPWSCMTSNCINSQGNIISKPNQFWHDKLQQELNIDCSYDDIKLLGFSYDLHYENEHCKLLIEVNPTFSHNSTYSYAYITKRTKRNRPKRHDSHFDKTQIALQHGYVCITIWDWDDHDTVIECIRKHLNGDKIDCADFSKNPQLSTDKSSIQLHWHNTKTWEHLLDNGFDRQQMIASGFVEVYDCGHALLKKIEK